MIREGRERPFHEASRELTEAEEGVHLMVSSWSSVIFTISEEQVLLPP